jgi:hypothetical protein
MALSKAGKTIGAGLIAAVLPFAFNTNADSNQAQLDLVTQPDETNVPLQKAALGKPVTMTFGSHYDEIDVKTVRMALTECPLSIKWKPAYENGILIETDGKKAAATDTGYAAALASHMCLPENSEL